MIKLLKLELKNFLSHVDTTLELSSYNGLVLIEGNTSDGHYSSNGAGKSTLLEGIVYALTGDTLRGVSVNDVVNRNYKKNTKVSLHFMKDDVSYLVTRYRKDDIMGDSLVIVEEGKDISKRVNKETQKLLEDILGISYKILISTVLLGEGLSSRFTQLSDPEKKSLIETTLNLNYDINKIRDSVNEKLKSLKLQDAKLDGEILVLKSLLPESIDILKDSIADSEKSIFIYQETIKSIEEDMKRVSTELESINPRVNLLKETLLRYDTLASQYMNLMQRNEIAQKERDAVLNSESPICGLCHQHLQSNEAKQSVLSKYENEITENLKSIASIEEEIQKIPERQILENKISELTQQITQKSQEYNSLSQDYNKYNVSVAETRKDIESMKTMIDSVENTKSQLSEKTNSKDTIAKDIKRYEYFYKLFSPTGIIVRVLSEAVEYINTRLSTYSEILLEKDYHLNFVKGKISLVDSKGSSYQSLSNGEKRRLDIAIQFSLHDYVHMYCGMKLDCCYIDEILDTLDDIGVENIFDVLRLKIEYCQLKSIYVITHNNSLKSKFDQVITITKDSNGDSHIL